MALLHKLNVTHFDVNVGWIRRAFCVVIHQFGGLMQQANYPISMGPNKSPSVAVSARPPATHTASRAMRFDVNVGWIRRAFCVVIHQFGGLRQKTPSPPSLD